MSRSFPAVAGQMPSAVKLLWQASRPLTAAGLVLLAMTVVFGAAMLLDPRTIAGAPAWLKPAKFGISTALFCLTMAWVFRYLTGWPRLRVVTGSVTAAVFVVEVALIATQASRGTASHFNVATPLDVAIFATMGIAIAVQTVMTIAIAAALLRQQFADRALGWALRLGLVISIAGASTGGLMTRPTADQLASARAGAPITRVGAHTVGAPDGGPGLPGTGWSRDHGDLRVPHFVGLHAMQLLPLAALLLARRRLAESRRVALVFSAAGSYTALFLILLLQALGGQPVLAPDAATLTLLAAWAMVSAAIALTLARVDREPVSPRSERMAV